MLSGIELYKLLKNVDLKGVRIGKIWRKEFFFVFELSGFEKKFMLITKGFFIFSNKAPRFEVDSIAQFLRKRYSQKRIEKIEMLGLNRIVAIYLQDTDDVLIFELFGRGNFIITDRDFVIKYALHKKLGKRTFEKGTIYEFAKAENPLDKGREYILQLIKGKKKAEIARILGLGKKIEDLWSDSIEEFVDKLFSYIATPFDLDELEKKYEKEVLEQLVSQYEGKKLAEVRKLEKVLEDLRRKREEYLRKAELVRKAADSIFMNLAKYDTLLDEARKKGEKKIKVNVEIY